MESQEYKREREVAEQLGVNPVNVCTVGSTLICGKGNDLDLLCLVPNDECLTKAGFAPDVDTQYESELHSWRRDGINIIAVQDRGFFLAEVAIAHGARVINSSMLDMNDREDRITFHSEIRNSVSVRLTAGL
jgi:hypothetical protein